MLAPPHFISNFEATVNKNKLGTMRSAQSDNAKMVSFDDICGSASENTTHDMQIKIIVALKTRSFFVIIPSPLYIKIDMPNIFSISIREKTNMKNNKNTADKKEKSFFVAKAISGIAPKMTVECVDRYELLLGGCKRIEEYSEEQATVATASCNVKIRGKKLSISFSGDGKILLSGKICCIEFI